MTPALRTRSIVSVLLAGMLCACGKKEQPATTEAPAAPAAKPEVPAKPAPAPEAKKSADAPVEAKAPPAAPAVTSQESEREFTGTVGGQPVVMGLSIAGEPGGPRKVSGWYYLESAGSAAKVPLSGSFQDGTLTMDQTVNGQVTGSFELSASDAVGIKSFLGLWKGLGKVLPVKLGER
ncbi:MAG: hypothetical protein K1X78_05180 [Verrucomicrobiaceae bacterium]|nr:hypothetical protein [Verrucomicrobiaceae bacterium]